MESIGGFYGLFLGPDVGLYAFGAVLVLFALGFLGVPFFVWTVAGFALLAGFGAPVWAFGAFAVVALIGNIKPLRRVLVSKVALNVLKGIMPAISETERVALEAGTVWAEGEFFSGKPDMNKLMDQTYAQLTAEEQAFIDGPIEKLCSLVDDDKLWREREIPKEAWDIIKKEKLLGMIIPREYGGLGFSAMANSEVVMKLSSRSLPVAITVMVPNSLGPAELLVHYGTDEQKNHYLPRLASGEEIPCFALTEPTAGSDAGGMTSEGVLFRGPDGKLQIKLNWNKRYITLAAIATTLGLAFRLRDPENLLGRGTDLGITCALIPAKTPGVVIGRRHDPLSVPFYNCPTQGHDVVVPTDYIVGGIENAGKGWQMLMECLAAGRGISLPAQSVGGIKLAARVVSNHSAIRKQFNVPIGKFEGIEEPLARTAATAYAFEATRRYTLGALNQGMKPAVVTAMVKYAATEAGRKVINDAMDVIGGGGISLGSRNLLGHIYISTPIGITVEGANILTRTLMIFGQGALRAHPYAFKVTDSVGKGDLQAFDNVFWRFAGNIVRNLCRSIALSWTRGWLSPVPVSGPTAQYYRKLSWSSASFSILTDIAMGSLGGSLKMKEMITGRFADILCNMYVATSTLRRYEAEGRKSEDLPLVHYSLQKAFYEIQVAFDGILANLPVPGLTWLFRGPVRWWSGFNSFSEQPNDALVHDVADILLTEGAQRDRLTDGIYMPKDPNEALGRQERAFRTVKSAEKIDQKIRSAVKQKKLAKGKGMAQIEAAFEKGIITKEEKQTLTLAEEYRWDAIQVDDYSQDEYLGNVAPGSQAVGKVFNIKPA